MVVLKSTPFRFQRWVALAVVAWALMDLTVPGLCPTELGSLEYNTLSSLKISIAGPKAHAIATSSVSTTMPVSSDDQRADDDCWCCSSHVAPTPLFEATTI